MSRVDDGLRPLFRKHLPMFHWQSVESGLVERGIPDANYCALSSVAGSGDRAQGVEGWIEFKATSNFTVDLRPEQVGWILTRRRYGGRVFVAIRRRSAAGPRKGAATDTLYLYDGWYARELREQGLRAPVPCLLTCDDGPRYWDWELVRSLLAT